jgi:fermentation-respiration switch protein FrsA (DUF1100 family)
LASGRIPKVGRKTPAHYGLTYQDVLFPSAHSDRVPLSGWVVSPDRPRGVVLLCHGIGSTRSWMLNQAVMVNRMGWASLLFDFRARGSSGGTHCTFGQRESDDVRGAVDYLKGRAEFASLPLVGSGQSLGAAALLLAMADDPRIQGAVAEACFARLSEAIEVRCRWVLGPWSGWAMKRVCEILLEGGVNVAQVVPVDRIAAIAPRPLLLIHDCLDITLPRRVSQELYQTAANPKAFWNAPFTPHSMAAAFASTAFAARLGDFLGRFEEG